VLPTVRFGLLDGITHAASTRHGGVSPSPYDTLNLSYGTPDTELNVAENRRLFVESLGVSTQDVVSARLNHGSEVKVFHASRPESLLCDDGPLRAGSNRRERYFHADAVVSDVPGLCMVLTFADCVPLLFADRKRSVVGAAHAGWRGTALALGARVVTAMRSEFGCNPTDIVVGIGPSIGPCCYNVKDNVVDCFIAGGQNPTIARDDGIVKLDLWATNERQLVAAGVPASNIENAGLCTSCHVDRFFSHRAERGKTGRCAIAIGRE
jgi:YfiH family protein